MISKTIKILIIDDDQVDRTITHRILKNSKDITMEITEATNSIEAINQLEKHNFDCILLDYQLPDSNGFDLLNKIKKISPKFTPIIMLTGQGSEDVAVSAMKAGVTDYVSKNKLDPVILKKSIINAIKQTNLKRIIHEQREKIKHFSYFDNLTGLLNRHSFEEMVNHALFDAKRLHHSVAIILVDIDNFMAINDSIGHLAGNEILIELGRRLVCEFSKNVLIARYGDDEYAILLKHEKTDPVLINTKAKIIIELLNKPCQISSEENPPSIHVSIGIACYPGGGESGLELLKNATHALAKAKNISGSAFNIYS